MKTVYAPEMDHKTTSIVCSIEIDLESPTFGTLARRRVQVEKHNSRPFARI